MPNDRRNTFVGKTVLKIFMNNLHTSEENVQNYIDHFICPTLMSKGNMTDNNSVYIKLLSEVWCTFLV